MKAMRALDLGDGRRAEVHSMAELTETHVSAWCDLAERSVEPNPFFEPQFVIPANRHLRTAPQRLLVVRRDAEWLAVVPAHNRRWRRVAAVSEAGEPSYGFLSTPLIAAEQARATAAALLVALRASGELPLVMQRLPVESVFFAAVEDALEARTLRALENNRVERALLVRSEGDGIAHIASHHRRELKRMARRLAEDVEGEIEVHDRAGDPEAIERFLDLEAAGWKGRAGTAMAAVPGHADFFRELCRAFHSDGRLQLFELGTADRLVASKCNLIAGEGSYSFKIAFDEQFKRWSPGVQLEVANVERFNAGELRWMDSCADSTNAMINRLWQERLALTTILLADGGLRSRTGAALLAIRHGAGRGLPSRWASPAPRWR
jgi:CelD/BcsL family acetyltransferase involved in cellulose biosynthesis